MSTSYTFHLSKPEHLAKRAFPYEGERLRLFAQASTNDPATHAFYAAVSCILRTKREDTIVFRVDGANALALFAYAKLMVCPPEKLVDHLAFLEQAQTLGTMDFIAQIATVVEGPIVTPEVIELLAKNLYGEIQSKLVGVAQAKIAQQVVAAKNAQR